MLRDEDLNAESETSWPSEDPPGSQGPEAVRGSMSWIPSRTS